MRDSFAAEIMALADADPRVVLLSGDIGNRMFDKYKAAHPERFFNCGVAEANMIGTAAGLAMGGLTPVAYTIVPFITTRCLEQIRVDLCYHEQHAVIAGVGGGLCYASLGATHHSCEDVGLMRLMPGMTVLCPGDPVEVRLALRAAVAHKGPVYLRLGKKGEPVVHKTEPIFQIGKGIPIKGGEDVCLLACGNILPSALEASGLLGASGISAAVYSLHTVKPIDVELLAEVFNRFDRVVTIEEHSILGGLGGAVAEWLADRAPMKARLVRLGTPDAFLHEAGEQDHARERFGLTPEAVARSVRERS